MCVCVCHSVRVMQVAGLGTCPTVELATRSVFSRVCVLCTCIYMQCYLVIRAIVRAVELVLVVVGANLRAAALSMAA